MKKKELPELTLREFRTNTGRTQRNVAEDIGVPNYYISQYESGEKVPAHKVKLKFKEIYHGYNVTEMKIDYGHDESLAEPDEEVLSVAQEKEIIEEQSIAEKPVGYIDSMDDPAELVNTASLRNDPTEHQPAGKIYILAGNNHALAFQNRSSAIEELTKIILGDMDTYGWEILEAELR